MTRTIRITTKCTDDLDGSKAAGPVTFGYAGNDYEIDLSKRNTRKFHTAIAPYLAAARKVRNTRRAQGGPAVKQDYRAVREWARANGYVVSDRGRVPRQVIEAYDAELRVSIDR